MYRFSHFLFIFVFLGSGCSIQFPNQMAPFTNGCSIDGGLGQPDYSELPKFIRVGLEQLEGIDRDFEIVYSNEFIDGGEDPLKMNIALFHQGNVILYDIAFKEDKPHFSKRELSKKERKICFQVADYWMDMVWESSIKCAADTYESYGYLFLRKENQFQYYIHIQDCEFDEAPAFGINKNVMEMIGIFNH